MPAIRHVDASTLIYEVAVYLANSGVGSIGTPGSIYYGSLPATPSEAVGVLTDGRVQDSTLPMAQKAFQVLIRGKSRSEARDRASRVLTLLHGKWNVLPTLKGHAVAASDVGMPFPDQNNWPNYSLNFTWVGQAK